MAKRNAPREPDGQAATALSKQKRHSDRRSAILDAARKLLVTQGIEHFAVAEVAELAGLSKPAVYYYFESKEEIVIALAERVFEEESAMLLEAAAAASSGSDALRRIVCAYVEHYLKHLDAFRILYVWPQVLGIQNRLSSSKSPWSARAIEEARERMLRDAQAGSLRGELDPELLVGNAWALAHGLVSIAAARGLVAVSDRFSLQRACQELSSYLLLLAD